MTMAIDRLNSIDFTWFHIGLAVFAVWYVLKDKRPLFGRNHALGSETLLFASLMSLAARKITGVIDPVFLYASIDILAMVVFAWIMFHKKAMWAAVNVILHTSMIWLHLAYFVQGGLSKSPYLWMLGGLSVVSVLTVIFATWTGRHAPGERLDNFIGAYIRGWSWSGLVVPRVPLDKR